MALSDLINTDVENSILNTNDLAETITRIPGGDGAGVPIVAILQWRAATIDQETGRAMRTLADCLVQSSTTIGESDAIKIGSDRYEVTYVNPPDAGTIKFGIQQVKHYRRTRGVGQ